VSARVKTKAEKSNFSSSFATTSQTLFSALESSRFSRPWLTKVF